MKNYIARLTAWKNTQNLALMQEETALRLREIEAEEGKDTTEAIATMKAIIAQRKASIEDIKAQIAAAKAKLAA